MMYYITVTAFETLRLRQGKSYVLTIRLLWRAPRRCGGTGRRTGLKILRDLYSHTGSIPVAGIISRLYKNEWILILVQLFCVLRWERVWRICICVGRKLKNNDKS